jgi:hypothetical protein
MQPKIANYFAQLILDLTSIQYDFLLTPLLQGQEHQLNSAQSLKLQDQHTSLAENLHNLKSTTRHINKKC